MPLRASRVMRDVWHGLLPTMMGIGDTWNTGMATSSWLVWPPL